MPLPSTAGLHHLWHHSPPLAGIWRHSCKIWQTECDVGKTSIFHSRTLWSGCHGIQAAGDHRTVPLPFSTWIHAAFKHQPHVLCFSEVALSPLSLLFHGKLTLRRCFHFLKTHWLIRIPWPNIHYHDSHWESPSMFHTEAKQHPERKVHGLQMAWSNLLSKPFEDCQDRLCPHWVLLLQSNSVLL